MPESQELATVQFQGQTLTTVKVNDEVFVGLKQIAEALGVDWRGQQAKLQTDQRYGVISMPLRTEGGEQQTVCIPLTKLNGWLFGINPNKVKPELRPKVIAYQEECFAALWQYWHEGKAERAGATALPPAPTDVATLLANEPLSSEQQTQIKAAIKEKMRGSEYVHAATFYLYSRLKRQFQAGQWTQIKRGDFAAAMEMIRAEDGSKLLPNAKPRPPQALMLRPQTAETPTVPAVTANPPSQPEGKRYRYTREDWILSAYPHGVTPDPLSRDDLLRDLWNLPLHRLLQELQADGHEVQGAIEEAGLLVWFARHNSHIVSRQMINCITGCAFQQQQPKPLLIAAKQPS